MKRVLVLIFVVLFSASCFWLIYTGASQEFDSLAPLKDNEYYRILLEEKVPRADLTSFLVTDSKLVLYYDTEGLVNVYALDGEFSYGIQIQVIRNGYGDFTFQDDTLYIMSRGNRMYIFKETELIRSFLHNESPDEFADLEALVEQDKTHSIEDTTYYYLSASNQIVRSTPLTSMETVIALPQKNNNIHYATLLFVIVIAAFMHYIKHGEENH